MGWDLQNKPNPFKLRFNYQNTLKIFLLVAYFLFKARRNLRQQRTSESGGDTVDSWANTVVDNCSGKVECCCGGVAHQDLYRNGEQTRIQIDGNALNDMGLIHRNNREP